ncbi:hypothetical protein pb186bvf_020985 [Paramecium bursaria]
MQVYISNSLKNLQREYSPQNTFINQNNNYLLFRNISIIYQFSINNQHSICISLLEISNQSYLILIYIRDEQNTIKLYTDCYIWNIKIYILIIFKRYNEYIQEDQNWFNQIDIITKFQNN